MSLMNSSYNPPTTPLPYKPRLVLPIAHPLFPPNHPPSPPPALPSATKPNLPMSSSTFSSVPDAQNSSSSAFDVNDYFAPPLSSPNDMLFGAFDFEEHHFSDDTPMFSYEHASDSSATSSPQFIDSSTVSPFSLDDTLFDSGGYINPRDYFHTSTSAPVSGDLRSMSQLVQDSPTSPIPIPMAANASFTSHPYISSYPETVPFPRDVPIYSQEFGQWQSTSPNSLGLMLEDMEIKSASPDVVEPAWVSELWDSSPTSQSPPSRQTRQSLLPDRTQRRRVLSGPLSVPLTQPFLSSSAPTATITQATARSFSRRAESVSENDDRDGTIRVKKAPSPSREAKTLENNNTEIPLLKPVLKPPKLAPSAWQLFFTDWIQRHQTPNRKKLNVAQAAKEAGQEYATLSAEEKEPYRRRSQAAKDRRERDMDAYMRSLTPEEIKRENLFRTEQRKLGKSRRSNIKDPNAPKKPLSAYFMFLQRIRSDPELVQHIFGDETETTKQSVLAAAKWRSMTDEERKPFLAQAERDKIEYEAARRLYEEGTTGYTGSINFSILPQGSPGDSLSPLSRVIKVEPESDSEGRS